METEKKSPKSLLGGKLRNCVLAGFVAFSLGACKMPNYDYPVTNEQLEQDFKSYAHECGIEYGFIRTQDAVNCLTDYISTHLYGKLISATGVIQQDDYGVVRDMDMYSVDIRDMFKKSDSWMIKTSTQSIGTSVYPDGIRYNSRVQIDKEEMY